MFFFDSHCHFDFTEFDNDRESVWQKCTQQGIRHLLIPGVSPDQWPRAADLANTYEGIYWAAGLHPWLIKEQIKSCDITDYLISFKEQLVVQLAQSKCVAVGECGLDAAIDLPMGMQKIVFEAHLQIAQEIQTPLIIHCRKAHNDMLQLLKSYKFPTGGVIHGFSGSTEIAKQYWALGFHIGIGGTITYERANKTREAAKQLPLEAILLETDAPDMPLQGRQGERNQPAYLIDIANQLAQLRDDSVSNIAHQTSLNAHSLFKVFQ